MNFHTLHYILHYTLHLQKKGQDVVVLCLCKCVIGLVKALVRIEHIA